jgi:hypothetical protein
MSLAALMSYWALNLVQAAVVLLPGLLASGGSMRCALDGLLIAGPAAAVIASGSCP